MKTKLFTVQEFDSIVDNFVDLLSGEEDVFNITKQSIIGAIIDSCYYNKQSFVYNGNVYTMLTADRHQKIAKDLLAIGTETVMEWALTIKLGM